MRERGLLFRYLLLLEVELSLALDRELVVGDLVLELSNGIGGAFGGE
jgi:hypothetical protein